MTNFSHKKLADKMGAVGRSKLKSKKRNAKIFRNKPYNDESMKEYFIDIVDTKANKIRHDYNNPNVFLKGTDLETIKKQVLSNLAKVLESSCIEYKVSEEDFHECKSLLETFLNNLQLLHEDYEDHEENLSN